MFINAIEESAQNRPIRTPVAARQIKGEEELRKFMKEWEKAQQRSTMELWILRQRIGGHLAVIVINERREEDGFPSDRSGKHLKAKAEF